MPSPRHPKERQAPKHLDLDSKKTGQSSNPICPKCDKFLFRAHVNFKGKDNKWHSYGINYWYCWNCGLMFRMGFMKA